jgi:hypothetical protein
VEITLETATLVRVDDLSRIPLPRDPRALGAATAALLEALSLAGEAGDDSK